jgi:hypothetical protein
MLIRPKNIWEKMKRVSLATVAAVAVASVEISPTNAQVTSKQEMNNLTIQSELDDFVDAAIRLVENHGVLKDANGEYFFQGEDKKGDKLTFSLQKYADKNISDWYLEIWYILGDKQYVGKLNLTKPDKDGLFSVRDGHVNITDKEGSKERAMSQFESGKIINFYDSKSGNMKYSAEQVQKIGKDNFDEFMSKFLSLM